MQRRSRFFSLVLISALVSTFAYPQPFRKEVLPKQRGLMGIPDLSVEQIQKIEKLRLEHRKDVLSLRSKIKAAHLDLEGLIMEESAQKDIDKKVEEIGKMETELMKKRIAHRIEIRNLLTDEQKVIFDSQRTGHRGRWYNDGAGKDFNRSDGCFHRQGHPRW